MREGQYSVRQGDIVSSVLQQAESSKTVEQSATAQGKEECVKF